MTAQLIVPGLGIPTTHLGYGCSQLMGGITRRQSIALLEAAFDAGVRHFDTAPSYGYGHAESVLGETFRARRAEITVATKFGLRPPRNRKLAGIARRLLLPVVKHAPGVKARLSRTAAGLVHRARFSPDDLRQSIDASLVALRTDYIDILLLHESLVADLSDELLGELEHSVKAGKIRSFGIGSEAIADIYREKPRFCRILQFEWSVLDHEKPAYPGSFLITHRSLSGNLARLHAWLNANPGVSRSWANELGLDVTSAPILSWLMLAAARHANPDGITLFSSRSARNIKANAQQLQGNSDLRTAAAFAALVARDAAAIVKPPQSDVPDRRIECRRVASGAQASTIGN